MKLSDRKRAGEAMLAGVRTAKAMLERERRMPVQPPKREKLVASGRTWTRVNAPKRWHPCPGEVLEGTYQGRRQKTGVYGGYMAVLLQEPDGLVRSVSGTVINALVDGACIEPGATIRIVFLGSRSNATGENTYNDFDLYVADAPKEPT